MKNLCNLFLKSVQSRELGVVFESSPNDGNVEKDRKELTGAAGD